MTQELQTKNLITHLLANREAISLKRATEFLVRRARLRTPIGSAEYLKMLYFQRADRHEDSKNTTGARIAICVEVMELYRALFPREYAASMSPAFSIAREQEFYRLLNLRMFPVELSQVDAEPEFFWPGIPISSKQPHDWERIHEHGWEDGCARYEKLETAYKLAMTMCEHRRPGMWRKLGLREEPAPPLSKIPWSLFVYTCRIEDTPIKYLPLAFYITHSETGNLWLDTPKETPLSGMPRIEWNLGNVIALFSSRTQASMLLDNVNQCSAWLDQSPANLRYAAHLWNQAAIMGAQTNG